MSRDDKSDRKGVPVRREEIPEELSVLDAERRKHLWTECCLSSQEEEDKKVFLK